MFIGNLMGGLGNQLFQICAVISFALKYNTSFTFSNKTQLCPMRHSYWDTMLFKLKPFLQSDMFIQHNVNLILNEANFSYDEYDLAQICDKNILFDGYFQSYKYFQDYFKSIYDLLKIDYFKFNIIAKYNLCELLENNTVVSLHFRIGDYKHIQHCHPVMPISYYSNSLQHLMNENDNLKPMKIIYFCENNPDDLQQISQNVNELKQLFPSLEFIHYDGLEDWEEMILMSVCNYNIIANSTFSWWGAYLNTYSNKKVLYPCKWFGHEYIQKDTTDLFPPEWICINNID